MTEADIKLTPPNQSVNPRFTGVPAYGEKSFGQKKASVVSSPRGGVSHYGRLIGSIQVLLEDARRSAVRAVNGMLVATYWEIGRRIVEYDQSGNRRAAYGEGLVKRLSRDLAFHLQWPISQKLSAKSGIHGFKMLAEQLRLSWSHNESNPPHSFRRIQFPRARKKGPVMESVDFLIVSAGIVGLAVANELSHRMDQGWGAGKVLP